MKWCRLIECGRSIFIYCFNLLLIYLIVLNLFNLLLFYLLLIVLICCLSHISLNSRIHICKCTYQRGEKKKNLLKLFPSSTILQVHSDTYNYLLPHHPSPLSPPKRAPFPKTLSLFFYKQRSYTYIEGRDEARIWLKRPNPLSYLPKSLEPSLNFK